MPTIADHLPALPGGSYPLGSASHLEEHLRWMRRCARSPRTLHARRRSVSLLAEWLGHDPLTATLSELESWQDHLCAVSTLTMRTQTALIRPYFDFLHQRGYRPDNPARLLPMPRAPLRLPRPMAADKLDRMLEGDLPERVRCWLLIAGWLGLRAHEIAAMRRDDFTRHGTEMWLRIVGKGNRQRNVYLPDWLWRYLDPRMATEGRCWRRERGAGDVTAQHVSQYCNEHLRRIGITDTFHSLRHRVATDVMEESDHDLRLVQALMGHATVASTALYTLVAPRRMAAALDRLPPPRLALVAD
jgi:site-specific recombinase XerD